MLSVTWILIYWIMGNGSSMAPATASVEFSDEVACRAALAEIGQHHGFGFCTPKTNGPWLCWDGSAAKRPSETVYQCPNK
jgi:hypothetical protein